VDPIRVRIRVRDRGFELCLMRIMFVVESQVEEEGIVAFHI